MLLVNGIEGGGVPGDDPGLTRGWTAFDTLRCYRGKPFRLEAHLERLVASAARMDIPPPDPELIRAEIARVSGPDHRIRITLTAGGNRVVDGQPIDPSYPCCERRVARLIWEPLDALPGTVKHGSRGAWLLEARRRGVDEVLFVGRDGHILESNRSGILAVDGGAVRVPPLDGRQLASVTRCVMLEAAAELGLEVRIEALPSELEVDELYLVSTLKELSPVVEIDGRSGPGRGPVGARLLAGFRQIVARECGQGAAATT